MAHDKKKNGYLVSTVWPKITHCNITYSDRFSILLLKIFIVNKNRKVISETTIEFL